MKQFFDPQTVAVIGATDRPGSVGRGLMENLLTGDREIFPINPDQQEVLGLATYPSIISVPTEVDLAIIAVPQPWVKQVAKDCADREVKGVIIISAGFGETGPEGKKEEQEINDILAEKNIPLIGPNCLGLLRPSTDLNASFAPGSVQPGGIALISQSGALIDSIIDGSQRKNYGFSLLISSGNAAGMQLTDYLRWAEEDPETRVITCYIEGLRDGRQFFEILRTIKKPVVVLKPGKSERSRRTISSHTGSLAGQARIFSAALKQAGAVEVDSIQEMLDVSKALAWQKGFSGGIAIITNGGGAGVLATDYLQQADLPDLDDSTLETLAPKMHPGYSAANPLDIVGDALPERYRAAIEAVLGQDNIQALLVIQTLQIMTEPQENAKIMIEAKNVFGKTMVTCFMGGGEETMAAIKMLEQNGVPNYQDPLRAAQALLALNKSKQ